MMCKSKFCPPGSKQESSDSKVLFSDVSCTSAMYS
jgi:hypothetical protein